MNLKTIDEEEFLQYNDALSILLITVTPIEKQALHQRLFPLPGKNEVLIIQKQFLTYYIGVLGKYAVCHVESKMGSIGAGSSIMTIQHAVEFVNPIAIIMVGIAFGVNPKEQKIGDVLVAEQIIQYESLKIRNGKIQGRGFKQMASVILLNRFSNPFDWNFALTKKRNAKVLLGNILSGEKLIDDERFRNRLLEKFGPAIGGEMEGAGFVSVAHTFNKHWLVVKGICDYADGNKGVNKEKRQKIAADSAVDLCVSIFNNEFTFKDLGILPITVSGDDENNTINMNYFSKATFNAYSDDVENYYLKRRVDDDYKKFIEVNLNVWSFGESGLGKTCMTFRNVFNSSLNICVIDLSATDANDMISVFDYIDLKLLEYAGFKKEEKSTSLMQSMDYVCKSISKHFNDTYIVFEEMPISNGDGKTIDAIFSFVIKYIGAFPSSSVRFSFTSIANPLVHASSIADKMKEKMHFIELMPWSEKDIKDLLNLMIKAMSFDMSDEYKNILVGEANGNPRRLKTLFRNFILFTQIKSQSLEASLKEYFKNK